MIVERRAAILSVVVVPCRQCRRIVSAAFHRGIDERTGNSVGHVIMPAGAVIDAVLAAASRAPFEAEQLRDQLRIVEKIGLPGIDDRQQFFVEVRLRLRGWLADILSVAAADRVRRSDGGGRHTPV